MVANSCVKMTHEREWEVKGKDPDAHRSEVNKMIY